MPALVPNYESGFFPSATPPSQQPQVPAFPAIPVKPMERPVAVGSDPMDSKGARWAGPPLFKLPGPGLRCG